MKILYISRLFTGLETSLINGVWEPTGVPTIYKMIEKFDDICEHLELVFTSKDGFTAWNERKKISKKIRGLNHKAHILPGVKLLPQIFSKKISYIIRELNHLRHIIIHYLRIRPDIVYIDNANIISACLLSRLTNTPVVFRVMGVYPAMRKILLNNRPVDKVFKYFYGSPFQQVICTQDGSGVEPWLNTILNNKTKVDILINGVDEIKINDKMPDQLLHIDKSQTIILYVGKFENSKGCIQFLKGFIKAYKSLDKNIHAIMIGSGSKNDDLIKISKESIIKDSITIINQLPHSSVLKAHEISDVYVSLNRFGNLSNANLEAMKYGQCMIIPSSQKQSSIDIILDELVDKNSIIRIKSSDDIDGIANNIIYLYNNPLKRHELSSNIKTSADLFITDWDKRINRELKIISELL